MSTESQRLSRQLRRAVQVRRWPLRRKVAVGAWIPVLVVAMALLTGPNRASGHTKAALPQTIFIPTTVTTLHPSTPLTSQRTDIGLWIQGKGRKRRMTIAGSINVVDNQAQLRLKGHYLHLAVKQADRRARLAANAAANGILTTVPPTKNTTVTPTKKK